jgi:hypothetical protein
LTLRNTYNFDKDITKVKIRFKVEKSWISANDINVATIALYRYANTWNKLDTAKLSEDSSYVYFEAITPGFSYFAISGETITPITPTTTLPPTTTTILPTTTTLPEIIPKGYEWIYWVMAVVVIVAVVFLSWKFLKKK